MADGKDERQLEELDIVLGMTDDPAAGALAALREHQEAAGMTFRDPDAVIPAPPGGDEEL